MASTIGNMNGKWAIMFKLALAIFPVVCGVLSGSVKYVYDHELRIRYIEATRFTPEDIKVIRSQLDNTMANYHGVDARIDRIESKLDRLIDLQLQAHNRSNP